MQLDRKMLNKLLALNDRQLQALIDKLAHDYGLDLSQLSGGSKDLNALRAALRNASDGDLLKLAEQLKNGGFSG